jgi:hypothetical protein
VPFVVAGGLGGLELEAGGGNVLDNAHHGIASV